MPIQISDDVIAEVNQNDGTIVTIVVLDERFNDEIELTIKEIEELYKLTRDMVE